MILKKFMFEYLLNVSKICKMFRKTNIQLMVENINF
jgi:hypothetical protein